MPIAASKGRGRAPPPQGQMGKEAAPMWQPVDLQKPAGPWVCWASLLVPANTAPVFIASMYCVASSTSAWQATQARMRTKHQQCLHDFVVVVEQS